MENEDDFEDWLIAREECISDEWYRRRYKKVKS